MHNSWQFVLVLNISPKCILIFFKNNKKNGWEHPITFSNHQNYQQIMQMYIIFVLNTLWSYILMFLLKNEVKMLPNVWNRTILRITWIVNWESNRESNRIVRFSTDSFPRPIHLQIRIVFAWIMNRIVNWIVNRTILTTEFVRMYFIVLPLACMG